MRTAITLDPAAETPLQRQICDEWRRGIVCGRFRGGDRVPSTRELARTLGIARTTVTAAYEQLTAEGYLETAHGSGTFVSRELPEHLLHAASAPARQAVSAVQPPAPGGFAALGERTIREGVRRLAR